MDPEPLKEEANEFLVSETTLLEEMSALSSSPVDQLPTDLMGAGTGECGDVNVDQPMINICRGAPALQADKSDDHTQGELVPLEKANQELQKRQYNMRWKDSCLKLVVYNRRDVLPPPLGNDVQSTWHEARIQRQLGRRHALQFDSRFESGNLGKVAPPT